MTERQIEKQIDNLFASGKLDREKGKYFVKGLPNGLELPSYVRH